MPSSVALHKHTHKRRRPLLAYSLTHCHIPFYFFIFAFLSSFLYTEKKHPLVFYFVRHCHTEREKMSGQPPKVDEFQPHPIKEQLPGIDYCLTSSPSWRTFLFLSLSLLFGHYCVHFVFFIVLSFFPLSFCLAVSIFQHSFSERKWVGVIIIFFFFIFLFLIWASIFSLDPEHFTHWMWNKFYMVMQSFVWLPRNGCCILFLFKFFFS